MSVRSVVTSGQLYLSASTLTVTHGITLLKNATITLARVVYYDDGIGGGTVGSGLGFTGNEPQSLAGEGKVVLATPSTSISTSLASVTIGPDITITGNGGSVGGNLINKGLITGETPNSSLSVSGIITNDGTIGVTGKIGLDVSRFNSGTGTLVAQNPGTTFSLSAGYQGTFTQASLGKVVGAIDAPHFIVSYGTLTGGLLLDSTTGSWALAGGGLKDGAFRATGGATLQVLTDDGYNHSSLDGVSVASDLMVNRGVALIVKNDLQVLEQGKIHLSGGALQFNGGRQNLTGNGEVLFESGNGADSAFHIVPENANPASVSIEAGVTIRSNGGNGVIGDDASPNSIKSAGQIIASNGKITLQGNFTNQGMLRVDNGGTMDVHARYSGTGVFKVTGGVLTLSSTFTQTNVERFIRTGGGVIVTGTITGGLNLNVNTGSWDINGGTLVDGAYTATGGAQLRVVGNGVKLDDMTLVGDLVAAGGKITLAHDLTFANNAKILLSAALDFGLGATFAGQGEVVLVGGTPQIVGAAGAPLTIGPGVTIRSQDGKVTLGDASSTLVNQGAIILEAAGAALDIQGRLTNDGSIRVAAGLLTLDRYKSGSGSIDVVGGTLTFAGTVTQVTFANLHHTGGDINVTGTVAGGLALDAVTGSFNLAGGKLAGGTYSATGGARLRVTAESRFDSMTIASDLDVASSTVGIIGGLILSNGAVVHLIGDGASAASLDFRDGNQVLGGQGEVRFEGSGNSTVRAVQYLDDAAASLTIRPTVTIRTAGGEGTIGGGGPSTYVTNNGVVSAEGAGRTITFKDTFNNAGSTVSSDGASLSTTASFTNAGSLTLGPGTVFNVADGAAFSTSGTINFQIAGAAQSGQFGRIISLAPVTLGGTANIQLIAGSQPADGDVYALVQAPAISGAFGTVNGLVVDGVTLFTPSLTSTAFTLAFTGQVPTAHVTDVFVSNDQWGTAFKQSFTSQELGDATYGYRLGDGDTASMGVPWTNLNQVSVRFDHAVNVGADALVVRGVRTAAYDVLSFKYDAAALTATWTLAAPLGSDAILLNLKADGVRSLDGDYAGQFPSGDGATGGDFRLRLSVLPGDVNQSGGVVNAADLVLTRNRIGRSVSNPGSGNAAYSVFNDLNGDGVINANDLVQVRNRVGTASTAGPGFSYPNFADAAGIDFFGDAFKGGGVLRLVPAAEHRSGAVRRQDVQDLSMGFTTTFSFRYGNVGGILDDSGNHGADGLAFTVQPPGSGSPVLAGGGLSVYFDAFRDGTDVSSSRVGIYLNGAQIAQFDAEALGILYRDGHDHTAQIDSSGSFLSIRLDGHLLGHVTANLGETGQVGFAGFTGQAYADADLANWSFRPTALAQPAAALAEPTWRSIAPSRRSAMAALTGESGELV